MALIEIKDLCKVYDTPSGQVAALDHVSLSIEKGQVYGIIGMSGAGKSTLVRCVNRLDTPDSGEILIDGEDILRVSGAKLRQMRRRMSMIFQQFNLLMQRTVARNVRYPLEIVGVPRKKANQKVKELLELVGLADKANAYPAQLSGGQRQRVAIARALASDPEMLLCDEATSALDPMTTQSILDLLLDINRRLGITVVLITHEMAVIRQVCTRVAILDAGKIAEEGTVDDVFVHTKSDAGRRLFGVLPENAVDVSASPVPAFRVVFDGEAASKPIIAQLAVERGITANILSANIKRISNKSYGQMLIEIPNDPADKSSMLEYLRDKNLTVEEVEA